MPKNKSKEKCPSYIIFIDIFCALILLIVFVNECKAKNSEKVIDLAVRGISLEFLTSLVSLIFAAIGPISDARSWEKYDLKNDEFSKLECSSSTCVYLNLIIVSCVALVLDVIFYIFEYDMSLIVLLLISILYLIVFVIPIIVRRYIRRDKYIERVSISNEKQYFKCLKNTKKSKKDRDKDKVVEKLIKGRMVRNGYRTTYNEICGIEASNEADKKQVFTRLLDLFSQDIDDIYTGKKSLEDKTGFNVIDALYQYSDSFFEILNVFKEIYSDSGDIQKEQTNRMKSIGRSFSKFINVIWNNPSYFKPKEDFVVKFNNIVTEYRVKESDKDSLTITLFNSMICNSISNKEMSVVYLFNDVLRKTPDRDKLDDYFVLISFYLVTLIGLDKRFISEPLKNDIKGVLNSDDWKKHFGGLMYPDNLDKITTWFAELYNTLISLYKTIDLIDWMVPEYNYISTKLEKYDLNEETIKYIWFLLVLLNNCINEGFFSSLAPKLSEEQKNLIEKYSKEFISGEGKSFSFIKLFGKSANESGLFKFDYNQNKKEYIKSCQEMIDCKI